MENPSSPSTNPVTAAAQEEIRRNDTYRRCRRIDQIGKLCPGNIVLICHRPHNTSHCQTVEIVINKDQNSQKDRSKLCPDTALDMFAGPAPERRRASRFVHHTYHDPQNHQKHQYSHIIAVGQHTYDPVLEDMCDRPLKLKSGIKNTTYQYIILFVLRNTRHKNKRMRD